MRSPLPLLLAVPLVTLLLHAVAARADELRDAVDRVRQETGGYILSAQTLRTHGGKVHRVKVLTREGRVEVRQIAVGVGGDPIGFTRERRDDDERRIDPRWPGPHWRAEADEADAGPPPARDDRDGWPEPRRARGRERDPGFEAFPASPAFDAAGQDRRPPRERPDRLRPTRDDPSDDRPPE